MNKNTWIIGFTLFAMFFGAGNPYISNTTWTRKWSFLFWPAILAFALTGIGLPLLGVVVGAFDKHGYIGSFNKNITTIFVNLFNYHISHYRTIICDTTYSFNFI